MIHTTHLMAVMAAAALVAPTAPTPAPPVRAKLSVIATTPDLAAIAREIGGDLIDVKSLAKGTEDPHFVDPKPSHVVTLNRADVLLEGGAELELGWLPPLLESARNDRISASAPGHINTAQGIKLLEIPTTFDRAKGDVHALGNPHYLLDPVNVRLVGATVAEHLSAVDPRNAATYAANLKRFQAQVDAKLAEWQKTLAPFKGVKIVTYHKDFIYLATRFNLDVVENLEPKPGIAPSPAHLARVIETMKSTGAKVILVQPFQNRKTADNVARQTGGVVLELPQQPGVRPGTDSYFGLMDGIVKSLAGALGGGK
jgi:zinc/manganese transport system substrate-binding protein